jgi:hypothetical protein
LEDAGTALPRALRPPEADWNTLSRNGCGGRTIVLPGATIHLLDGVHVSVSSTQIRAAARRSSRELSRLVPPAVAEYIKKEGLYVVSAPGTVLRSTGHGKMLSLHRGAARGRRYE